MRLRGFELEIFIEENSRLVLTILNKALYRKTIMDFKSLLANEDNNDIVIEEEGKLLNYDKELQQVTDYYTIDFHSKSILNALYKKAESMVITNSDYHVELEILYKKLVHQLQEILLDCEVDTFCNTELDIIDLFKIVDLRLLIQSKRDPLEELYTYLDLIAYFKSKKLLVFFNLKSNFTKEEVVNIYKYMEYKKIKWICIENGNYDTIDLENKYLIDEDLVEFANSK